MKPFKEEKMIVEVAEEPALTTTFPTFVSMAKSTKDRRTMAEWDSEPPVPVTVT